MPFYRPFREEGMEGKERLWNGGGEESGIGPQKDGL